MLAIQKLLFKTWLRSPGPFFTFIFPLILMVILGIVFPSPVNVILPGIISSGATALGASSMAIAIVSFRNSVIIKRIAVTPITKTDFIIGVVTFYIMVAIVMVVVLTGLAIAFYGDFHSADWITNQLKPALVNNIRPNPDSDNIIVDGVSTNIKKFYVNGVDWFAYAVGSFVNVLLAIAIGALVIGLAKNTEKAIIWGLLFILPGSLLTGRFAPVSSIDAVDALAWISRALPLRYASNIMLNPCNFMLESIKDVANKNDITNAWQDAAINFPIVIGSSVLFTAFGIYKFKWER